MKRILLLSLTVIIFLALTACSATQTASEPPIPPEAAPVPAVPEPAALEPVPPEQVPQDLSLGKVALITTSARMNEEIFLSGAQVVEKYGMDKVIHECWPDTTSFGDWMEQTLEIFDRITANPEVKALIINPAFSLLQPALDKLQETRGDIFIVLCEPRDYNNDIENLPAFVAKAELALSLDEVDMGSAMVKQAHKLGATTFIHFSLPHHMMNYTLMAARRNQIRKTCEEIGIEFIDETAPDPTAEESTGVSMRRWFLLDNIPKFVEKYGTDTAFFGTACDMQAPMIQAIVDSGAIYPQPCCPSPYHGFIEALGIVSSDGKLPSRDYVISETNRILGEKSALGHISTWPAPTSMMFTNAGAEYAIKWLNSEVPQEGIDVAVLKQCLEDYAGVECFARTNIEDSVEYPNWLLVREDYLTYGEEVGNALLPAQSNLSNNH